MGSEARTRLGLAGVLLATLLAFNQLFEAGDYPGPAILGVLLASALVIGTRRLGIGSLATLALSGAGLASYLAFVFHADRTLFGLPTPDALSQVGRSLVRAYSFSQIDYAPVPVRPGYVIAVVAGMWAAATMGELATFRWKRPLFAALPSVAMFSTALVLGSGDGAPVLVVLFLAALVTFWGLEASHRVRSWGRWVATWPGRAGDEPESVTGPLARRMGAGCIAAALVAPIFLPALGDGLLSWRTDVGEGLGTGKGAGGGTRVDPLVSIAPTLVNQSDQVLFRVESAQKNYWRLVALPNFDGETWRPAEGDEMELSDGILEGDWFPAPDRGRRVRQRVTIEGLAGRYLPAAVQARTVEVHEGDPADLRYHPGTGDLRIEGGIDDDLSYLVTSVDSRPSFEELAQADLGRTDPVFRTDPGLSAEVIRLRNTWTEGADGPYEELVAIQDALRSGDYTYSLEVDAVAASQEASTDELTRFLLETKTGYCQQFATAFAALSRSLGYPTRVVVGFLPGASSGDDQYLVKGVDAHAWPEVFFDGYGWVRFEPTPRSDRAVAAAPDYTTPEAAGGGPLGLDGGAGRARNTVEAPDGTLDARALNDAQTDGTGAAVDLQEQARRGTDTTAADEEGNLAWERTFRRLALTLIVLTLAALGIVPALKARRIHRAYGRAGNPRAVAAAAFQEFMLEAGELAAPRGPAESARAYTRRIASLKDLPEIDALRLAAIYERAAYSASEVSPADTGEARRLVRELRSLLWHRASWWERAARLFSPRALLPR